ncbi:MAG: hypothetical protein DSZ08_05105 [Sulfurovum sp.]|nr:MAG: hypothetical protein DSZ08_05105 [Sulfurovum sp.]
MLKIKLIDIVLLVMIVLILDKLYLLPLYVPLDTKPDSRRSATYLAKSVAKEAKCDDVSLAFINFDSNKEKTLLDFSCIFFTNTYASFIIYVFLNDKTRDEMIKNRNKPYNGKHQRCFKKGPAYLICESSMARDSDGKAIFNGQKFYHQFSGEDLEYTIN